MKLVPILSYASVRSSSWIHQGWSRTRLCGARPSPSVDLEIMWRRVSEIHSPPMQVGIILFKSWVTAVALQQSISIGDSYS